MSCRRLMAASSLQTATAESEDAAVLTLLYGRDGLICFLRASDVTGFDTL